MFAKKTVQTIEDLMKSPLFNQPPTDLKNLVTLYNSILVSLINKRAPLNLTV